MPKTGRRAQLRGDRAVHQALRALAVLERLDEHATIDALRRPRDFVIEIARRYMLFDPESGAVRGPIPVMRERLLVPDAIPEELPALSHLELEVFRRIIAETLDYRDGWGPIPTIAIRPHWWAPRLFADVSVLEGWKAGFYWAHWEARRARALAEWCFDGHSHQKLIADAAGSVRGFLVHLSVRAAEIIADREALLLHVFIAPLGIPRKQARARIHDRADDILDLALGGEREAVYQAIREAGLAALDWRWARAVIAAWRAAADMDDFPASDRATALRNLKGVAKALSATGSGRHATVTPEERGWLQNNRPRLMTGVRALARSPSCPPTDLTAAEIKQARQLLASYRPADVVDRLLAKSVNVSPATARRYSVGGATTKK